MLIVYDLATGDVLDNTGTSSAWPEGPPDDRAFVNTDARGIDRATLGLLRLHDRDDAELVAEILTNQHHVDPTTGEIVIEGPFPEPVVEASGPTLEERIAALEARADRAAAAEVTGDAAKIRDALKPTA